MILLPESDFEQACAIAERLRAAVAARPLATMQVEGGISITISAGVATYPTDRDTITGLLEKADQAMYWAKRLGRNQVRSAVEAERACHNATFAALLSVDEKEREAAASHADYEQMRQAFYRKPSGKAPVIHAGDEPPFLVWGLA